MAESSYDRLDMQLDVLSCKAVCKLWCPQQHLVPQACATMAAPDIGAMHVRTCKAKFKAPSKSTHQVRAMGIVRALASCTQL